MVGMEDGMGGGENLVGELGEVEWKGMASDEE